MKIRVQKRMHMLKAINWYQEKITERFGVRALSEAHKELMRMELVRLQRAQQQVETASVWTVPVHVEFDGFGNFLVNLDNYNDVLFLDE